MRTTKRFTPRVLERFLALGRGTGTFRDYIPWHRVSRSDPSSRGQSHLIPWRGRQRELLSNGELTAFLFVAQIAGAHDDLREQFALARESSPHELSAYDVRLSATTHVGTVEIAKQLGIKHPMTYGDGTATLWVMTTDLLLMYLTEEGHHRLLAIACKDQCISKLRTRARALLEIERTYWLERGAEWLLITPELYHPLVAATLQGTWPWALGKPCCTEHIESAVSTLNEYCGCSLTRLLAQLESRTHDAELAQHALWQAIWSGAAPVDLCRGWRPHLPLAVIPRATFDELNPIRSRRSAWI